MKVTINEITYDSNETAIILELNDQEKELVSNMCNQTLLCVFPESMSVEEIEKLLDAKKIYKAKEVMN